MPAHAEGSRVPASGNITRNRKAKEVAKERLAGKATNALSNLSLTVNLIMASSVMTFMVCYSLSVESQWESRATHLLAEVKDDRLDCIPLTSNCCAEHPL